MARREIIKLLGPVVAAGPRPTRLSNPVGVWLHVLPRPGHVLAALRGQKAAHEGLSEAAWGWGRARVRSVDPVRALGATWCLCCRRVSGVNLCGTRGCCLPGTQLFVLML